MKTLNPIAYAICLATLGTVTVSTAAVADATNNNPLETITVTASRTQSSISDVAATVWIIDNEQIAQEVSTGADLKNVLGRLIPGFDFGSEGRTNFAQNLRGRTALVMIDGVSLNSTRQISRQLESIDPFNVARVEVLSGATSIYGAGAAGGIINIITKKAASSELEIQALAGLASGFNNSEDLDKKLALSIAGGNNAITGRLAAAWSATGGAYNADGDLILPDITQTDTQFNDTLDIQGNVNVTIDEQQSLSFVAQHFNSEQGTEYGTYLGPNLAGILGYPEFIQIQKGLSLEEQPETERDFFNLQYHHRDVLGHELLAQVFHRTESLSFFPFPSIFRVTGSPFPGQSYPIFAASEQDTDITGAKLVLVKDTDTFRLSYGLDIDSESFTAKQHIFDLNAALASGGLAFEKVQTLQRYPNIDSDHLALFAQGEWQANQQWRLSAGFRYQQIDLQVGDFTGLLQQHLSASGLYPIAPQSIPGGETDYDEWLFNAGAVYKLDANQQLWANISQGFDLPDPAKFFGQGNYSGPFGEGPLLMDSVNIANNPLSGIKTDSLELGWRKAADNYHFQLSAYYSLSDKTTSFNRNTLAVVVNDDERRIMGIEGQLNVDLSQHFYTSVQAHWLRGEVKTDGNWSDLATEEASPVTASIRFGYADDNKGLELQLQSMSDYDDEQNNKLDGYTLAHLNGHYKLSVGQLNFGIQNLFDEDYETIWSQRAQILYSSLSAPALFTYGGQGTRLAISYQASF
ncbi:TonB-dependent receptor [Paraneptunicella aestuarii]|uniref:TonB-dependent receptor n=1 Tax=Paraneptunicella aestuarii TaxID=2831148 RepID=UPI001E5FB07F|nr:TonB-dependent receptor [Paraneptunicella aestuarii]UAA37366.1 TonB-dependent receptor [Paraneptunicella aestuarii]